MMREYEGYWLKKGTVLNKKYAIFLYFNKKKCKITNKFVKKQ